MVMFIFTFVFSCLALNVEALSKISWQHKHSHSLSVLILRGGSIDGDGDTSSLSSQSLSLSSSLLESKDQGNVKPTSEQIIIEGSSEVTTENDQQLDDHDRIGDNALEAANHTIKKKQKNKRRKSKKITVVKYSEKTEPKCQDNITVAVKQKQKQKQDQSSKKTIPVTSNPKKKGTRSRKPKREKPVGSASASGSSKPSRGGKDGESLRRIKHEWKQNVKLGIGYDWKTMQTVTVYGRSESGRVRLPPDNPDPNPDQQKSLDDEFYKYNYIRIGPYGNNLLRWHFSVLGPANSCYTNGIYHGRILLPKDYPMSPPRVQMLTPSGRFHPGEDICLSASAFHPETWTPRWTILSLVDGLRIHMLTTANEIGGVESTSEKRRKHALYSRFWKSGPVDHAKMVRCGLFCDRGDDVNVDMNVNGDDDNDRVPDDLTISPYPAHGQGNRTISEQQVIGHGRQRRKSKKKKAVASSMAQIRKRRSLGEKIILLVSRPLFMMLKSPLRLGIILLAIYHFFLRPMQVSN